MALAPLEMTASAWRGMINVHYKNKQRIGKILFNRSSWEGDNHKACRYVIYAEKNIERKYQYFSRLYNDHPIAITIETILLLNRFFVSFHDKIISAESADEHQQRRVRQMKIRDQNIDHFEFTPGIKKQIRLSL